MTMNYSSINVSSM